MLCYIIRYIDTRRALLFAAILSFNLLNQGCKISLKGQVPSHNVSLYLQIQYLRSSIVGRIYRE